MSDRSDEVQKALRTLLKNDLSLKNTYGITDVYDTVPSSATFPYIRVSDITVTPQEIKQEDWFDYFVNLHVWIQDDGTIKMKKILGRLYLLLHRKSLSLDSGYNPSTYVLFNQLIEDPDGITRHGICRVKITD